MISFTEFKSRYQDGDVVQVNPDGVWIGHAERTCNAVTPQDDAERAMAPLHRLERCALVTP